MALPKMMKRGMREAYYTKSRGTQPRESNSGGMKWVSETMS